MSNIDWSVVGILITIVGTVWSLAWWLSNKFSELKDMFYVQIESVKNVLMTKLDYHEKHDDQRFSSVDKRFSNIRDDLWEIRVRNARVDNKPTPSTPRIIDED